MRPAREAGAHLFRREYDLDTPLEGLPAIANLCNALLADAFRSQARRVRLVPTDPQLGDVEYEIASQWVVVAQLPGQVFGAFINRLKVMSALDIGRVPVQEGELHVRLDGTPHVLKIHIEATQGSYELVTLSGLPGSAA